MTTEILFNSEGRKKVLKGINEISDAVKVTLGAKGRNVIISKPYYPVKITKDGVTVARSIELKDQIENIGATLIKEVASKTVDISGDGTTTATVLAQSIINAGLKAVESGASPMDLKKGIEKAVEAVVGILKTLSRNVDNNDILKQIATISANNDNEIGELIAAAFSKVGKDGVIRVKESKGHSTTIDIVDGMRLDRGYLSHHFITNSEKQTVEMENPFILLYDGKISMMNDILPILEQVSRLSRPLLIICEDLEGEALATLVVNKVQGRLKVCAIKTPEFGEYAKLIMEDVAAITGATFVSEQLGVRLDSITIETLGSADNISIDKDSCLIVGGKGAKENIISRSNSIKLQIERSENEYELDKLKTRLAKLNNGIAVLSIGGVTETEIKEKTDRVDDALCATKSASEEGFVAGGGVTFLHLMKLLKVDTDNEDEKIGVAILIKSLEAPFRQILENGGIEASAYIKEIQESEYGIGYNIKNCKIENLLETGVIDPTKVLRVALENASSIASIFLTTECIISEIKQQDDK